MKITKKSFCFFILMTLAQTAFCGSTAEKAHQPMEPNNIQVLIEKNASEALLEVRGPYYVYNPYDGARVSSGLMGKRFLLRSINEGLKWGEAFPGIHQIVITPRSPSTSILVNGIQYNGSIIIYKIEKSVQIINELPIEDYIKSILTDKFPYPHENEVMAAIAIAARTTAYYQITKNKTSFWHIDAKEENYQGSALVSTDSAVSTAVDATRNLILVNSGNYNKPFPAHWTEHSAGKTAPFHAIFRKDLQAPKNGVVASHAELDREESRWSYSIAKEKLAEALNLKNITSIELFVDQDSGKTYAFRIKNGALHYDYDFLSIQKALGEKYILSNDLKITMEDDEIIFSGFGKGLGVGLCLFSSSAMAQNGEIAIKILTKFFPNTYLINLSAISTVK